MVRKIGLVLIIVMIAGAVNAVDEAFVKQFENNYKILDQGLLNNTGEVTEIENFVYEKDVATFTFIEGDIHFQRYVNGRPTTAIFVGEGTVAIDVPLHTARQSLWAVAKDSTVNEEFEVLVVRFADDFDLALKEKFTFTQETLEWGVMAKAKGETQGAVFFKPMIEHPYDNYFRLLISTYERGPDGFFWTDFHRYTYTFDPNWPDEVQIGYEFEGGDIVATTAASFRRKEAGLYDDTLSSRANYPTTMLEKTGTVRLSGADGRRIDAAEVKFDLLVNADSVRFPWFYLQFNLRLDSVKIDDQKLHFERRRSFEYIGLILPKYYYKGDTLHLTAWYKGTNFDHFLPWINDPTPCPINLTFEVRENYNYYMAGMNPPEKIDGGYARISSNFPAPLNQFYFHCYPGGIEDTVDVISDIGLTINFVISEKEAKRQKCFIPSERYRSSIKSAFDLFSGMYGQPPQTFVEYVIPTGFLSMPGMMKVPQIACVTEGNWQIVGGFDFVAGNGVARQWFGALMRPASHREVWFEYALPVFSGLQFVEHNRSSSEYFANLNVRRDSLYSQLDIGQEMPLAAGDRLNSYYDENKLNDFLRTILSNKGVWLLHMLRFMMYDYETGSEAAFSAMMRELYLTVNNKSFTNADFINIAEKHFGDQLDWFFARYLYGAYIPKFSVEYEFVERDGSWYVPVTVDISDVPPSYKMPIMMRVTQSGGEFAFLRQWIEGPHTEFEMGPFDNKPDEFIFNEYLSALGRSSVSKK